MSGAIGIARSGLQANMLWLTASASNIANAQATGPVPDANGASSAYRPVRVEMGSIPGGAVTAQLVPRDPAYRLTYEPGSPHADARGMVAAPDVDITGELVEQIGAKLAFQANLKVIATASELEKRAIDLWG